VFADIARVTGDVFHIQSQCEGLANTLSRLAKGVRSQREKLQSRIGGTASGAFRWTLGRINGYGRAGRKGGEAVCVAAAGKSSIRKPLRGIASKSGIWRCRIEGRKYLPAAIRPDMACMMEDSRPTPFLG
jgi:hypothetical protein